MALVAGIAWADAAEPWTRYETPSELVAGALAGRDDLNDGGIRFVFGGSTALGVLALNGNGNLTLNGFLQGDTLKPKIVVRPSQAVMHSRTW